jgi:hypothetical protein
VWAQRVALPDAAGDVVSVTCIVAREVDPPAGVKPVEWRLLSNRQANDLDAAAQLIDWYRARWEVELFFHVLKNGCRVEALQLTSKARLERALALFTISRRISTAMSGSRCSIRHVRARFRDSPLAPRGSGGPLRGRLLLNAER